MYGSSDGKHSSSHAEQEDESEGDRAATEPPEAATERKEGPSKDINKTCPNTDDSAQWQMGKPSASPGVVIK